MPYVASRGLDQRSDRFLVRIATRSNTWVVPAAVPCGFTRPSLSFFPAARLQVIASNGLWSLLSGQAVVTEIASHDDPLDACEAVGQL